MPKSLSDPEQLFYLGLKALIRNNQGEILLVQEDPRDNPFDTVSGDYWDLPGGRIQKDETEDQGFAREMQEELGVSKVTRGPLISAVISNLYSEIEGHRIGRILFIFEVNGDFSNIQLSDEHTSFKWFNPQEAAEWLKVKYPPELTDKIKALTPFSPTI
jgi:8-oxo-dGTP diphosphatase